MPNVETSHSSIPTYSEECLAAVRRLQEALKLHTGMSIERCQNRRDLVLVSDVAQIADMVEGDKVTRDLTNFLHVADTLYDKPVSTLMFKFGRSALSESRDRIEASLEVWSTRINYLTKRLEPVKITEPGTGYTLRWNGPKVDLSVALKSGYLALSEGRDE